MDVDTIRSEGLEYYIYNLQQSAKCRSVKEILILDEQISEGGFLLTFTQTSCYHQYFIRLVLAVLSLIYLIHSSFCVGRWLLSDK